MIISVDSDVHVVVFRMGVSRASVRRVWVVANQIVLFAE